MLTGATAIVCQRSGSRKTVHADRKGECCAAGVLSTVIGAAEVCASRGRTKANTHMPRPSTILIMSLPWIAAAGCQREPQAEGEGAPAAAAQETPRGSDTHPAWSPDGQSIAFISNRDGVREGRPINFEVYRAAPDGSKQQRLTTNQDFEADVAWSPDGVTLLFKSYRDGNDEVYVADAAGTTQRNLTNAPASDGGPGWSPDGRTIVFHSDREGGETRLYLMNTDGSNVRGFRDDPGPGHSPQWSPDGSLIAFVSSRDGNAEIYVMEADGANPRRLTDDARENGYPRWRPDGTAIAHTAGSFETDRWEVVLTDLDGGSSRVLVDSTDSGNVAWSPDGSYVAFGRYRVYGENGGDESELFVLELATGQAARVARGGP